MTALVLRGDARRLPLPDASADLVVTSPPYYALRSYQDDGEHYAGQIGSEQTPQQWLDAMWEATREWVRVLKPSGSIFVNLGDKYATAGTRQGQTGVREFLEASQHYGRRPVGYRDKSLMGLPWRYAIGCIDQLGLILRAEIIWDKPNGLPESVTDRVRRSHEQWFHFTVSPRYYAAVDAIREPHAAWTLKAYAYEQKNGGYSRRKNPNRVDEGDASDYAIANPLGKLPGSVRTVASEPLRVPASLGVDHFAAFPTAWPRWLIAGWSPSCGVVLDPFGGTGTTAMVASALGRVGVSVDLSHDYCRLAYWRTRDEAQLAHARGGAARPQRLDPLQSDELQLF